MQFRLDRGVTEVPSSISFTRASRRGHFSPAMAATDGILPHIPSWAQLDSMPGQLHPREEPVNVLRSFDNLVYSAFSDLSDFVQATGQAVSNIATDAKNLFGETSTSEFSCHAKRKLPSDFKENASPDGSPEIERYDPSQVAELLVEARNAQVLEGTKRSWSRGKRLDRTMSGSSIKEEDDEVKMY